MWTYRARIVDVIDSRTVDVEIDLGFHIRTDARVILTGVPAVYSARAARAAAQTEEWIWEHHDRQWPFILTLERIAWHGLDENHERYIGTVTTLNGASLNEHMIQWSSDNPF